MDELKTYRVYFNHGDVTEVDASCEDEALDIAEQIAYESGYNTFNFWDIECVGGAT
jgi:hypothetical protein